MRARKSKDDGDRQQGLKARKELDSCPAPQRLILTTISTLTLIWSLLRTHKAPLRATSLTKRRLAIQWAERTGGEKDRDLRGPTARGLDEDVRYSSSFTLAEIQIEPHSMPAAPTRTEELSEGSTS